MALGEGCGHVPHAVAREADVPLVAVRRPPPKALDAPVRHTRCRCCGGCSYAEGV